jgi:hypothetical protein
MQLIHLWYHLPAPGKYFVLILWLPQVALFNEEHKL